MARNHATRRIALAFAALALFGGIAWCARHDRRKPPAPAPVPVTTGLARTADVPTYLSGIGTVQSLQQVVVASRIDGELLRLFFVEGQKVEKGQLLAAIDDRPYKAALAQARAEADRNAALLASANLDLSRYRNLQRQNAIASQLVDQQVAQAAQLKATLAGNRAAIESAEVNLSYTMIRSPVRGRVGLRRVDAGNLVRASDTVGIVTVAQIDPIAVVFTLSQDSLPSLAKLPPAAEVLALTEEGGAPLATGRLETIDNAVDPASGTIRLKAVFPNETGALVPGQFVVARLSAEVVRRAIVVPSAAVERGAEGRYVMRVVEGKAVQTPVEVGIEKTDLTVVTKGLAEGERVIVDGQSRVKPGGSVREASEEAPASNGGGAG